MRACGAAASPPHCARRRSARTHSRGRSLTHTALPFSLRPCTVQHIILAVMSDDDSWSTWAASLASAAAQLERERVWALYVRGLAVMFAWVTFILARQITAIASSEGIFPVKVRHRHECDSDSDSSRSRPAVPSLTVTHLTHSPTHTHTPCALPLCSGSLRAHAR